jgi:hypothetical protein
MLATGFDSAEVVAGWLYVILSTSPAESQKPARRASTSSNHATVLPEINFDFIAGRLYDLNFE